MTDQPASPVATLFPGIFAMVMATGVIAGFGFLTIVAATSVLAAASAIIHGWWALAWGLWWFALVMWPVFL